MNRFPRGLMAAAEVTRKARMSEEDREDGSLKEDVLSPDFLNAIGEHFLAGHVRANHESPMLRYASGLREHFARSPLNVDPGRQLAPSAPLRSGAYCPIYNGLIMEWRLPERAEELKREYGDQESSTLMKALADYWRPYAADVMWQGHATLDYSAILKNGFPSYVARIQGGLDAAREQGDAGKTELFQALSTVAHAIEGLVQRYVAECDRLIAVGAADAIPALEAMQGAFRQVLVGTPGTFYQAMQYVHLFNAIDGFDNCGRLDQYLYPFYSEDLKCGTIDPQAAEELFVDMFDIWGAAEYWNVVIGGAGRDGADASNELTYIILRARGSVHRPKPSLSLRLPSTAPDELLDAAFETLLRGQGQPAIYNDDLYVHTLSSLGVPTESAREFVFGGCSETHIAGRSSIRDAFFNALQPLLVVLRDGPAPGNEPAADEAAMPSSQSRYSGARAETHNGRACAEWSEGGPPPATQGRSQGSSELLKARDGQASANGLTEGLPAAPSGQFRDFDALVEAYKEQVARDIDQHVAARNRTQRFVARHQPSLIRSIFVTGCIEKGMSDSEGGAVHNHGLIDVYGIPNVANSLYVIKKLVYEERLLSLEALVDALDQDFKGCEELRMRCLAQAKYGNDIDEVDLLAREVSNHIFSYMQEHRIWNGGSFYGFCASAPGFHATLGQETGATPDGRMAGSPLGNSMSAVQGTDRNGPTALLNSINKLDLSLAVGTPVVNLSFRREMFEQPNRKATASLIRTFFQNGGMQLQFNIVDRATLRAALDHPEEHADLIVRVSGYSAYFTRLPRVLQEEIIERTLY